MNNKSTIMSLLAGLAILVCLPEMGHAQIGGIPLWNEPSDPGGVEIAGDVGFDSDEDVNMYAGRVQAGLGPLALGATIGVRDLEDPVDIESYGATAALRLIVGGLNPLALNLQAGYGADDIDTPDETRFSAAVGLSIVPPDLGFRLEPWISPGARMIRTRVNGEWVDGDTRFALAGGVRATFGLLGLHVGADHVDKGDTSYGVGLHLRLGPPL